MIITLAVSKHRLVISLLGSCHLSRFVQLLPLPLRDSLKAITQDFENILLPLNIMCYAAKHLGAQ